jgi:hypothetical protein
MYGYGVRAAKFSHRRGYYWIGFRPSPRGAQRRHMINIHTQTNTHKTSCLYLTFNT